MKLYVKVVFHNEKRYLIYTDLYPEVPVPNFFS